MAPTRFHDFVDLMQEEGEEEEHLPITTSSGDDEEEEEHLPITTSSGDDEEEEEHLPITTSGGDDEEEEEEEEEEEAAAAAALVVVGAGPPNAWPGVDGAAAAAASAVPVAVVGLGMIGSAAVRHLALAMGGGGGHGVLGIGPAEPAEAWDAHLGPFSSHYDQGRLARLADPDPVWALLAARSMARYDQLQRASGIRFHSAVGSIRVDHRYADLQATLDTTLPVVDSSSSALLRLVTDAAALRRSFPCFRFHNSESALVEGGAAGYINPRCMVAAQLALAERHGARLLRDAVVRIVPPPPGAGGGAVRIETRQGKVVWASKVLVCAGAYTGFLLPDQSQRRLDLRTHARTVILAEVAEGEEERLAKMPTFIWRPREEGPLSWVYGCPPTRYPDGRVMVKVGGTLWAAPDVGGSEAELNAWFRTSSTSSRRSGRKSSGGGAEEHDDDNNNNNNSSSSAAVTEARALEKVLVEQLMPDLRIRSLESKPCAVCFTGHGRPYIDAVSVDGGGPSSSAARIFVATGGCGAAAKSSDEIGRLAALLTWRGRWPCTDLDPGLFRVLFK